jgi:LPXTG-motif cell wall-anchored protein
MSLRRSFFIVILLVSVGFALRLYQVGATAFRGDEAFTALFWMQKPLSESIATVATVDPQPPLAYALFRGWGLIFGTNETTTRLLPALLSLLGIPSLYALGKRLISVEVGLLSAVFYTFHPFFIWHAQDARNYAIWGSATLVALWLAVCALHGQRWVDWVLYVIAASVAAYLYYLELFVLFTLNLFVLLIYWRERRLLLQWFAAQCLIGIILAIWYLQPRLLVQSGYGGTAGGFDPTLWLIWFLPTLSFGDTLPLTGTAKNLLIVVLPLLLVAGGSLMWKTRRTRVLLLLRACLCQCLCDTDSRSCSHALAQPAK